MFKKLKDKLAEEVKSSPQRIQQFAQAAQAAVTSASSSISDITNNDLFSIGDNESQQNQPSKSHVPSMNTPNKFQEVSLIQPLSSNTSSNTLEFSSNQDIEETPRQRRLSNSSFASDVSFRLPSYESPSMYHLQSDMEVSASEAEERGFSSGAVSLDRVTKEQLYAAYRRTQERYTKYRTQYADLARHYKLLERENAKAKSVLVETQDKALRRISELREQCALEQSAKAHLEKALRVDIEEKNIKIDTLNTKIQLLQTNNSPETDQDIKNSNRSTEESEKEGPLITLAIDNEEQHSNEESSSSQVIALNNKIEKMEQLINKYKESLKTMKEKNSQMATEVQMLSIEVNNKNSDLEKVQQSTQHLNEAKLKIQELNNINEDLQNKLNTYDFNKSKQVSTLEIELRKAQEEISELQRKIEVFSKREEDYAISLAENKLSIHKELESKEAEIKSLKDCLTKNKTEMDLLSSVIDDYKKNMTSLQEENCKLDSIVSELNSLKNTKKELESQLTNLKQKCQTLEQSNSKINEEYKCLQLQLKQETAEKLAMVDRFTYLENRNSQLMEENTKKRTQITNLETELRSIKHDDTTAKDQYDTEKKGLLEELHFWKGKSSELESEIQEEREELIKLQSEIEKLIQNHELTQKENSHLREKITDLANETALLQKQSAHENKVKESLIKCSLSISELQQVNTLMSKEVRSLKMDHEKEICNIKDEISQKVSQHIESERAKINNEELKKECSDLETELIKIKENLQLSTDEIKSLRRDNEDYKSKLYESNVKEEELIMQVKSITEMFEQAVTKSKSLQKECELQMEKLDEFQNRHKRLQDDMEQEKNIYKQKIEDMGVEHKSILNKLSVQKIEIEELKSQLNSLETSSEQSFKSATDKVAILETENSKLINDIKDVKNKNDILNKELYELKNKHNDAVNTMEKLSKENIELLTKIQEAEANILYIQTLEENNKALIQENVSLKSQTESITNNIKHLEVELNEVRKSHLEIEREKDHLNSVIENLESKHSENVNSTSVNMEQAEIKIVDNLQTTVQPKSSEEFDSVNREYAQKYVTLQKLYESLKEENKRLHSDIEGHQAYISKISKDNSLLNDKLRELIGSSDTSFGDNVPSIDNDKNEIQTTRDKIDELMRENTLLVEENLELKDQLQIQNSVSLIPKDDGNSSSEVVALKEKYNKLLQSKNNTERRLIDLDEMNKSVTGNLQQVQLTNEKLKTSNEKLERRLDEALVSLRHLHSLQENTELEYLRNILYEYLTGSGSHSITLAKVLAAVVKFDDSQTKTVIQKEKERQGLLHQLGLL